MTLLWKLLAFIPLDFGRVKDAAFSTSGKILIATLAFVVWTAVNRYQAAHKATAACAAANLRATVEDLKKQQRDTADALARAQAARTRAEEELAKMETDLENAVSAAEKASKGPSCVIPRNTLDRLRKIR